MIKKIQHTIKRFKQEHYSIHTSKSSIGGPLSDNKEAFSRLWRLHVAKKAIS